MMMMVILGLFSHLDAFIRSNCSEFRGMSLRSRLEGASCLELGGSNVDCTFWLGVTLVTLSFTPLTRLPFYSYHPVKTAIVDHHGGLAIKQDMVCPILTP